MKSLLSLLALLAFVSPLGAADAPATLLAQPDKEIVIEYIKNEDYKYVRVLGAPLSLSLSRDPRTAPSAQ